MRQLWLKDIATGLTWNLSPINPQETADGCAFCTIKGLGYEATVEQSQVGVDYFVNKVNSKNTSISGYLYFNGTLHAEEFYKYIGDFGKQFELHYAPDGDVIATDQLSISWYKLITINKIDKNEKNNAMWFEVPVVFATQNDVWKRDIDISGSSPVVAGTPHYYPYFYDYVYGGLNTIAVDITNTGREVGCVISIKNTNETGNIEGLQWTAENSYYDKYGNPQTTMQYAKFNVILQPTKTLTIDSNALTQRAIVTNITETVIENVRNAEEADFDYIDYISLKNGVNSIYFNIGTGNSAEISISYQEQREFI